MVTRLRTRLFAPLLALLLASAVLVFAPAATAPADAAAPRIRATITFDKNPRNPHNSRLVWKLEKRTNSTWRVVERKDWRAGSGFEGRSARKECAKGKGWLPNGTYSFVQHDNYWGNFIKGRAFFLGNHACWNGTMRTELFIHTETGSGNRQCRNTRGDQLCRWEYPKINDYKSNGCIKMSPGDLLDLTRRYKKHFAGGVRHSTARVRVRVIS